MSPHSFLRQDLASGTSVKFSHSLQESSIDFEKNAEYFLSYFKNNADVGMICVKKKNQLNSIQLLLNEFLGKLWVGREGF